MANPNPIDPLVSAETEVEVDAETALAIEQGLRDAKEGRVVPSDDVRKQVSQWITKFSTQKQR
jgi:predicted transcriptional regulator